MCFTGGAGIGDIVSGIGDVLGEVIGGVADTVTEVITDIPSIGDMWSGISNSLGDVFSPLADTFSPDLFELGKISTLFDSGYDMAMSGLDLGATGDTLLDGLSLTTDIGTADAGFSFGSDLLSQTVDDISSAALDANLNTVSEAASALFPEAAKDLTAEQTKSIMEGITGAAAEVNAPIGSEDWAKNLLQSVTDKAQAVKDVPWYESAGKWLGTQAGLVFENPLDPTNMHVTGIGVNPVTTAASLAGGPLAGLGARLAQYVLGIDPTIVLDFNSLNNGMAGMFDFTGAPALENWAALAAVGAGAYSLIPDAAIFGSAEQPKSATAPATRRSNISYTPLFDPGSFTPINLSMPTLREQPLISAMQDYFDNVVNMPSAAQLQTAAFPGLGGR